MIVLFVMEQEFVCSNTREYINIPPCSGKLVVDFSRLQEGIFVYSLVKLYNKANFMFWYVYGGSYKAQLSRKHKRVETDFHIA